MDLIFIIAIISAVAGGVMASNRGRSPIGWAIICFFTSFLGLILLAILGLDRSRDRKNASDVGIDLRKWNVLKEVDPDIADAAQKARMIGVWAETELARKFLILNDKSHLPALLKNLVETPRTGSVNGLDYRSFDDGSVVVTRGKYVGESFGSLDDLKAFGGQLTKR